MRWKRQEEVETRTEKGKRAEEIRGKFPSVLGRSSGIKMIKANPGEKSAVYCSVGGHCSVTSSPAQ